MNATVTAVGYTPHQTQTLVHKLALLLRVTFLEHSLLPHMELAYVTNRLLIDRLDVFYTHFADFFSVLPNF